MNNTQEYSRKINNNQENVLLGFVERQIVLSHAFIAICSSYRLFVEEFTGCGTDTTSFRHCTESS
jgi:hypothetical protein